MKDLAQCETVVPCSVGGTNLVAGGSDESADNAHDVSLIVGCLRCALARAGYLPRFMGVIHPRFRTPWIAILAGGAVGIAAIYSDTIVHFGGQPLTANIVTMSALGALLMYILSMLALIRLRECEPDLPRPFRAIGYPFMPAWTLLCASVALGSLVFYNRIVSLLFVGLLVVGYVAFRLQNRVPASVEQPAPGKIS
jgi:ethanolamine permease